MPDIIVIGEALVDLFAEPGDDLAHAKNFSPHHGGAPANVAVAAARLGGDVGFVGKVGRDGFGVSLRATMAGAGVDVSYMTTSHRPTMIACVALPQPDRPEFVLFEGANAELRPEDIDAAYLKSSRVMAFGSVTLAYPSDEAVLHAARFAGENGADVVFDVNLRPAIWPNLGVARGKTLAAVDLATIVKLNEDEARFLFGEVGLEDAVSATLDRGPHLCCVSLGERGAYFANRDGARHVPGFGIDLIDATGCGDAFLAGLMVRMNELGRPAKALSPDELEDIVTFANASGATVGTSVGGMAAPLDRRAVDKLKLEGHRND